MLDRTKGLTAFLVSVSVIALWSRQAAAGPVLPTPICDAGDPTSTIESCDILIREYKEYLSLRELDIRKKNASDPERSKAMREYEELEMKLDKTIENEAKIQSKIGSTKSAPKSSFR